MLPRSSAATPSSICLQGAQELVSFQVGLGSSDKIECHSLLLLKALLRRTSLLLLEALYEALNARLPLAPRFC